MGRGLRGTQDWIRIWSKGTPLTPLFIMFKQQNTIASLFGLNKNIWAYSIPANLGLKIAHMIILFIFN